MQELFRKLSTLVNFFHEERMPEMAGGEPKPEVITFTDEEAGETTVDKNRRELLASGALKPGQELSSVNFPENEADAITVDKNRRELLASGALKPGQRADTVNFVEADVIEVKKNANNVVAPQVAQVVNFTDAEAQVIEAQKPKVSPGETKIVSAKEPRKHSEK